MPIRIEEDIFGEAEDPITETKRTVRRFTFTNDIGIEIQVITLGATLTALKIPDECGELKDIVLGFDNVEGYQSSVNPYFGCTVGRVCNRIKDGKFELNGEEIQLSKNHNDKHHIHGGFVGLDKVIWNAELKGNAVIMSHTSQEGHEGYPGILEVEATFMLCEFNEFSVNYKACSSAPTPVNLTNHAYFNLGGHGSGKEELFDHILKIKAERITETDDESIPTGKFIEVESTAYDFRKMTPLSDRFAQLKETGALGYDNNYCVELDERQNLSVVAKVAHAKSGRWLEVLTNQPGLQFYTSNYFPDPEKEEEPIIGKGGAKYFKHGGFCLESQKYPDAVNHPNFPSIILNPGNWYCHDLIYKFGVCIGDHAICKLRQQHEAVNESAET